LLAPAGAALGTLFVFDHRISDAAKANTSLRTPSNILSNIGEFTPYAIPGTMWFLGAVNHNPHTAEAGRLSAEAELDSEVVMNVIKIATGRTRPNLADNRSFPSGHAMSNFALAAVLSREYHDKKLIVFGSYGMATAISLARVGGLNHFPSDVLAGAIMGELIGRYVVHHHARMIE
jgi:membrane-associated phospholipid phosphatase